MTEKRYYYDRALDKIKNRETGDDYWFLCDIADLLNNQDDKIRELQERNDRQRKRLDNLYQLIFNRDYEGQEELIKELEEYEQSLQDEMKLYCRWYE